MPALTPDEQLVLRLSCVEAVIFDMDGLMLDSEVVYLDAWSEAAAEQGFQLTEQLYRDEFVGRRNEDCEQILAERWGTGFDRQLFRARWPECWRERVQTGGMPMKPGLMEVLAEIDLAGVPRAVATSSDRRDAEASLDPHGLRPGFSAIVTGDEVQHGKPAPDIFLKAAALLGASPSLCLVLEDSEAGVRAARAAGMLAILIPDLKRPAQAVVDLAAAERSSLHEVAKLLARAFAGRRKEGN